MGLGDVDSAATVPIPPLEATRRIEPIVLKARGSQSARIFTTVKCSDFDETFLKFSALIGGQHDPPRDRVHRHEVHQGG